MADKNFKSKAAYLKWIKYGHASGEFKETPGNQSVSIRNKNKKVEHTKYLNGGQLQLPPPDEGDVPKTKVKYKRLVDSAEGELDISNEDLKYLKQYNDVVKTIQEKHPEIFQTTTNPNYKETNKISQTAGVASGNVKADYIVNTSLNDIKDESKLKELSPYLYDAGLITLKDQKDLLDNMYRITKDKDIISPDYRAGVRHLVNFNYENTIPEETTTTAIIPGDKIENLSPEKIAYRKLYSDNPVGSYDKKTTVVDLSTPQGRIQANKIKTVKVAQERKNMDQRNANQTVNVDYTGGHYTNTIGNVQTKPEEQKAYGGYINEIDAPEIGGYFRLKNQMAKGGSISNKRKNGGEDGMPFGLPLRSVNPSTPYAYESPKNSRGEILPDPNRLELLNTGATEYKMGIDMDENPITIPTVVDGNYMNPDDAVDRYMLTGERFKEMDNPAAYSNFYNMVDELGLMKLPKQEFVKKMRKGGDIKYGTPEYNKAYREGTIARQVGDEFIMNLPNAEALAEQYAVTAKSSMSEKYPYWNNLNEEQKKYINEPGSIGRGVRAQATSGYGINGNPTFAKSASDFAMGSLTAGPVGFGKVLQTPQSLAVEGIEALRGNPYNFSDAVNIDPYSDTQRSPSDTFLKDAPGWVGFAGDVVLDPTNLLGASFIKNPFKTISSQAFRPGKLTLAGKNIANLTANQVKNINKTKRFEDAIDIYQAGEKQLTKSLPESPNAFKSEIDWSNWNKEIPENKALMKEYEAIEQTSKADGTWMKNPDGSTFQGTPEQFVQQNSENFKRAFPNVLRDETGNIQKTYHGSQDKFESFDPSIMRVGRTRGQGIYTSPIKERAASYADKGEKQLYEFYQNANKKQTILEDFNALSQKRFDKFLKQNPKGSKDFDKKFKSFMDEEDIIFNRDLTDDAFNLNKGYDFYKASPDEYVVPFTNYPKSAIGNNGMFDMTNPNIYKALVPAIGTGALAVGASQEKALGGYIDDNEVQAFELGDYFRKKMATGGELQLMPNEDVTTPIAPTPQVQVPTYQGKPAPIYSGNFNQAFGEARNNGDEVFTWNNKVYGTKLASSTKKESAPVVNTNNTSTVKSKVQKKEEPLQVAGKAGQYILDSINNISNPDTDTVLSGIQAITNKIDTLAKKQKAIENIAKVAIKSNSNTSIKTKAKNTLIESRPIVDVKSPFLDENTEKTIMKRQNQDFVYSKFMNKGAEIRSRTDVGRLKESQKFLEDLVPELQFKGAKSLIIDIGSGLENPDENLRGVTVSELMSSKKIATSADIIATDIEPAYNKYKAGKKQMVDAYSLPVTFETPIKNVITKREKDVKNKYNTIILRSANGIDLIMDEKDTYKHFDKISKDTKEYPVYYMYNKHILYKPANTTTFSIIGELGEKGFDHRTSSWKIEDNSAPYNMGIGNTMNSVTPNQSPIRPAGMAYGGYINAPELNGYFKLKE